MRNSVLSHLLCSEQQNAGLHMPQDNQESDHPILRKNDVNYEFVNGGNVLLHPELVGTNDYFHHRRQQQQQQHLDYGCLINTMPYDQLPELVPGIDSGSSSALMPRPIDTVAELGNYLQYCPPPTSSGMINKNQQMLGSLCDDEHQAKHYVRQGAPVLMMSDNKIKLGVSGDPSLIISKRKRARRPATERSQPVNYLRVLPIRRSQKLSDKIAVLHQLVCPYGKTDTASVLQEACTYIRNAHQDIRFKVLQVILNLMFQRLSSSYLEAAALLTHKNAGMNLLLQQQQQPDLRNRGLCLIPASISKKLTKEDHLRSDYNVASSNTTATIAAPTRF